MSTEPTPQTRPGWWLRFKSAVSYVLALEPVAVQGAIRAVLVLVAAVGLTVPEWVEPRAAGIVVAFYALVEVITTLRARKRSVPAAAVVEQVTPGGLVVAGEASELTTGEPIRPAGSLDNGGLYPQG